MGPRAPRSTSLAPLEEAVAVTFRLKALPYRAHTVLTDNRVQFAKKAGTEAYKPHIFDDVCYRHGIDRRLTKPFHPWANGQVSK